MTNGAQIVWQRARNRCEYCGMHSNVDELPFHIDHIIAQQHRGRTILSNLALACYSCNLHKGPNIAGLDPKTGRIVRLFHPRLHKWSHHFRWNGAVLEGRTAMGRTTVVTLDINSKVRVALRELLMQENSAADEMPKQP